MLVGLSSHYRSLTSLLTPLLHCNGSHNGRHHHAARGVEAAPLRLPTAITASAALNGDRRVEDAVADRVAIDEPGAAVCARARLALRHMRSGVRTYRHLFTFEGVLSELGSFMASGGRDSHLACEALGPRSSGSFRRPRALRSVIECLSPGAATRDACSVSVSGSAAEP